MEIARGLPSPDNRQVAFFADNKLKRIDLQSGTSQALANANGWFCAGTWSGDDVVLYSPVPGRPILKVAPDGGPTTSVTRIEDAQTTGGHCEPHFLPDGRHFFYTVLVGEGRGIYLARLDGAEARRVIQDARSPVYVPPGYLLFVREASGLFAQPFDSDRLELSGAPVQITDRVALGSSGITAAAVSASGNGTIVYRRATGTRQNQLVWFDRSGRRIGIGGEPDAVVSMLSMSSDGRTVALMRVVSGNVDVWILELARGVMNRLTSDRGNDVFPVWSPDGMRIVFSSTRVKGAHDLYVKTVGGGAEEPLLATTEDKFSTDWSPDGRYILYFAYDPKTQHDIWAVPLDGTRMPLPVVQSEFEERSGQFSLDGKWVAYQSNESGRFEIYVQPFPGPGPTVRVSTDGGVQVRWRHDGRELFYIALDRRLMAVPVRPSGDGRTLQADTAVPLFPTNMGRPAEHLDGQQYVVSRDGQRFLISTAADDATEPITILLNWKPNP